MPEPVAPPWSLLACVMALVACETPPPVADVAPPLPAAASTEWEGFVETARATPYVYVRLDDSMAVLGGNELPLEDLRAAGDSLGFIVDLGPQQLGFAAALTGPNTYTGRVEARTTGSDETAELGLELYRVPKFVPPSGRSAAWRQDLVHARSRFLRYDRSYSPEAREEAERRLDQLDGRIGDLSDAEIVGELARVTALSGNAHTRMYLLRNRTALRRVPVRLWWFADGLHVIRTDSTRASVVGCRVARVDGVVSSEARDRVSELFAANASWADYKSAYYLTSPAALRAAGIEGDSIGISYGLECPRGSIELGATAAPLTRRDGATENWRNLSPGFAGEESLIGPGERWTRPLEGIEPPAYLSNPTLNYWYETIPGSATIFIQYNRSQEDDASGSISAFADAVQSALDRPEVTSAVVDLRFNTGGDLGVGRAFFDRLVAHPDVASGGRLFVLTGQSTFSAGLFHAAQLRASGVAILVGREPGDELEYWSEGGNIVLPNSGYTMHFSNGYHSYSGTPDPAIGRVFQSLSVPSLRPDLEVRMTATDYFAGRDPLLDAALARIGSSSPE